MLLTGAFGAKAENITIGGLTNSSATVPTDCSYNNSVSQFIYTASEIGGSCTITSITFNHSDHPELGGGCTAINRSFLIYFTITSQSNYSSASWVPVASSDLVCSSIVTMPEGQGTLTIIFNTPYRYNGSGNLAITVVDNNSSWTSQHYFLGDNTGSANRSLCKASDNTSFSISALPGNPTGSKFRPRVSFGIIEGSGDNITVSIGDVPNRNSLYMPINTQRKHSVSQTLYTAEQMGNRNFDIASISYRRIKVNATHISGDRQISVYLQEVSDSIELRSTINPDAVNDLYMTGIYHIDEEGGYYTIYLDRTYHHTAGKGLVITIIDDSINNTFRTDWLGINDEIHIRCRFAYNDTAAYNVSKLYRANWFNDKFQASVIFNKGSDSEVSILTPSSKPTGVNVILAPNPTTGMVRVESDSPVRRLELYSLQGTLLQRLDDKISINLGDYAAGVYMLRVITDKGATVQRIIKK